MIHGKNLMVLLNGTAVAASKTCTVNKKAGTIEISSPNSGSAREYVADRTTWDVTTGHLVEDFTAGLLSVGQTYTLTLSDGTSQMSGTAICTEYKVTATKGNLAQGSFKFQGTGVLAAAGS